jgi:hypothetical protein
MGEGWTTAWPEGGGEYRCTSDMEERERKGNGPYQGHLGTNGEINKDKEMWIEGTNERRGMA